MNPQRTIVVLDDDPTGTQTVANVAVLTAWDQDRLTEAFRTQGRLWFVLTNSRAMDIAASERLHRQLMRQVIAAARSAGTDFEIVSRSDSTLRGHYPLEPDVIRDELERAGIGVRGELLVPFFAEGGRVTEDDVHYVVEGDRRTPAAQTEFARDKTFGYRSSNLRQWIVERAGRGAAGEIESISLEDIRVGGPSAVLAKLMGQTGFRRFIVNAACYEDVRVVAEAVRQAWAAGRRFVHRSAASFVQALACQSNPVLLGPQEYVGSGQGVLVVVGSHVAKTTAQLERLLAVPNVVGVELDVAGVLGGDASAQTADVARRVEGVLRTGQTAVLYTSRHLVSAGEGQGGREADLAVSVRVSAALCQAVSAVQVRPRCLIAKGGITSSDIATRALGVTLARVLGQALPGVPVWRLGDESRWPGLGYVVFPGNVGDVDSLAGLVWRLQGGKPV